LALVCVDEGAEEHVYDEDEDLGIRHGLPEIHWAPHFSHELDKNHTKIICSSAHGYLHEL
jgi:hypothetical protein